MEYKIFTATKGNYGYIVKVFRKGLTLEKAREICAERMVNPNRKCTYTVVAESRVAEYLEKIEKASAKIRVVKDKKWAELDLMKKQGYKVKDAIEYLNK